MEGSEFPEALLIHLSKTWRGDEASDPCQVRDITARENLDPLSAVVNSLSWVPLRPKGLGNEQVPVAVAEELNPPPSSGRSNESVEL